MLGSLFCISFKCAYAYHINFSHALCLLHLYLINSRPDGTREREKGEPNANIPPKRKLTNWKKLPAKVGKHSLTSAPDSSTRQSDCSRLSEASDDSDNGVRESQKKKEEELEREGEKFVNTWAVSSNNSQQKKGGQSGTISRLFGERDFSYLTLKPDYKNRPMWIDPKRASS